LSTATQSAGEIHETAVRLWPGSAGIAADQTRPVQIYAFPELSTARQNVGPVHETPAREAPLKIEDELDSICWGPTQV
jgi:hypothetical protein